VPSENISKDYDDIPIRRSYVRDVLQRLEFTRGVSVEEIGHVRYGPHRYPLVLARYPRRWNAKNPTVLLSAGMHGGESAGMHALLDFLRNGVRPYGRRCNFAVFPCVNPSGFEADTRETMAGVDCNRAFGTCSRSEEVRAVEQWLDFSVPRLIPPQLLLAMDLHEDGPDAPCDASAGAESPLGCYLYETMCDRRRRIGRVLIDALPSEAEACTWSHIYGDINDRGVIAYPEGCRNPVYRQAASIDAFLVQERYADHVIVTETPTVWSMEKRIAVQRLWLRKALDFVLAG